MDRLDDIKADILAAMEYWDGIYEELNHSSDRVAAIAALAHIEALLQAALCTKFTHLDDLDRLFGPDGALMPVTARSDLAYALDIIPKETMRDIKTCARVRNLFAHAFRPVRFTDEPVDKLIAKLATFV